MSTSVNVTFASIPDAARTTVTVSAPQVLADGHTAVTVTVKPFDANGVNVACLVGLAQSGGAVIAATPLQTNAGGVAVFSVTDVNAETVQFIATDLTDGIVFAAQPSVRFIHGLALAVDRTRVPVGGALATFTATVTAPATGAPAEGVTLALNKGLGSAVISGPSGPSDGNGQVIWTASDIVPETVSFTVSEA